MSRRSTPTPSTRTGSQIRWPSTSTSVRSITERTWNWTLLQAVDRLLEPLDQGAMPLKAFAPPILDLLVDLYGEDLMGLLYCRGKAPLQGAGKGSADAVGAVQHYLEGVDLLSF